MLDDIDRETSVSFLSQFEILMRFVHQTKAHIISDIFTTTKKKSFVKYIVSTYYGWVQQIWYLRASFFVRLVRLFLYVYYVRLLLLEAWRVLSICKSALDMNPN